MNKFLMCSAAGAALVLTGCQTEVMNRRNYVPAPKQDPAVEKVETAPAALAPETAPAEPLPVPAAEKTPPPAVEFQPMTGVKSSGGVDSAPRSRAVKSGKKGRQAAVAGGTYIVRPGDNPQKIAHKCHVSVPALMAANHLDKNSARKLRVGQKLVIPGKAAKYSGVSGKKAAVGKKGAAAAATAAVAASDGMYTVKPGDNPYTICRKLKVRRSDLLKANNLSEAAARKLRVGQKLVIPGKAAAAGKETAPAAPAENLTAPAVPEETPAAPAETAPSVPTEPAPTTPTAPTAPAETAPAAPADTAANLGNYEMTVVSDQEIKVADFAARYGISEEELRRVNPDLKGDVLTKEQMLFVPKK